VQSRVFRTRAAVQIDRRETNNVIRLKPCPFRSFNFSGTRRYSYMYHSPHDILLMTKKQTRIRVLVADDHAIFRDGLRKLFDSDGGITIVGEAQNGAECITLMNKLKPDILLLDLRMPDKDGFAVLEEINFDTLSTRVVVLTAAEDDRDVIRAVRLGARGVVLKQSATDLLIRSIQRGLCRRDLARQPDDCRSDECIL
jgi:CheY-like chemotaxis protein